jgi:hypothetical protein
MVHGRQNFGPTSKHKSGDVKQSARKSAQEAATKRIRATRQETPHERGSDDDLKRELEAAQRRAQRRER